MRVLFLVFSILLVAWLGYATPIDPKRWLVNRPQEVLHPRSRRAPQEVKGTPSKIGRVPLTHVPPSLRKGEYICNGRVCKLQPGEVPKGCNGICQYPITG